MTIEQAIARLKRYDKDMPCAFALWVADDVNQMAGEEHFGLTGDQVAEVLNLVERHHDASIGINWEVIREHVRDVIHAAKQEAAFNQRAVTWGEREGP